MANGAPKPPILPIKVVVRHTAKLIIDPDKRQHIIKGDWYQVGLQPNPHFQIFNWKYSVTADRDVNALPHNGKYMGAFKVPIDNGKKKSKLTDVVETVEKLVFTKVDIPSADAATANPAENKPARKWTVKGKGSNKFGHFILEGTATCASDVGSDMDLVVDKTYVPADPNALPDACETHDVKVCCLRGTMKCVQSNEGHAHVTVEGMWSSDRLNLLVDPEQLQKDQVRILTGFARKCHLRNATTHFISHPPSLPPPSPLSQIISKFRLEHKSGSSYEKFIFPPDKNIKYSGWFEVSAFFS